MIYQNKIESAELNSERNKKLVKKLYKSNPRKVDELFHGFHDEVFKKIDCLKCANCCKTTSPIFTDKDIRRLAKHFRVKETKFIDDYLYVDKDDDYVLKTAPCPFLMDDNECSVYDHRPNACKEYPHTNRKKMTQLLNLSAQNSLICPAVSDIFEKINATI